MWTHVSLNLTLVWEEVLYTALAIWQDDLEADQVVMRKSGRVALPADGGPDEALAAVVADLAAAKAHPNPWTPAGA
jgi:hypothetical protein